MISPWLIFHWGNCDTGKSGSLRALMATFCAEIAFRCCSSISSKASNICMAPSSLRKKHRTRIDSECLLHLFFGENVHKQTGRMVGWWDQSWPWNMMTMKPVWCFMGWSCFCKKVWGKCPLYSPSCSPPMPEDKLVAGNVFFQFSSNPIPKNSFLFAVIPRLENLWRCKSS